MEIRISNEATLSGNTLYNKKYGNSIQISDALIDMLGDIQQGMSIVELSSKYHVSNFEDIINELIQQGFLYTSNQKLYDSINPVNCVGIEQSTFFGVPFGNLTYDISLKETKKIMGFIDIPYNMGSTSHNISISGPMKLRKFSNQVFGIEYGEDGLSKGWYSPNQKKIVCSGMNFKDYGSLEIISNQELQIKRISRLSESISKANIVPIFIGGDHTISAPIIQGFLNTYEKLQVIQLDAHSDLGSNRWGMVEHGSFMSNIISSSNLKHVYQVGIRGPLEAEEIQLNQSLDNLSVFYGSEFDDLNIDSSIPTYITIDVDVFDPSIVPSVNYPVPNGWSYSDFLKFVRDKLTGVQIVGIDIVEYNESDTLSNMSASTVSHAVLDLLGGVL
ncbi:hypothetical protein CN957_31510 [Bacillus cereus]|nr:Agmatinase [Bacillus mycoides]PFJ93346.1 hypothetical protein COI97_24235 [Bacillus cereus]PGM70935.1 hypothetical protein CN957_31510 [Bacillus cereus]